MSSVSCLLHVHSAHALCLLRVSCVSYVVCQELLSGALGRCSVLLVDKRNVELVAKVCDVEWCLLQVLGVPGRQGECRAGGQGL